jgi:hypothetical protein
VVVGEGPEIRLHLDQLLAHALRHLAHVRDRGVSAPGVGQIDVKPVNEDQVRDLVPVLQRGVERIDAAAEQAGDARSLRRGGLALLGQDLDGLEARVPAAEHGLYQVEIAEQARRDAVRDSHRPTHAHRGLQQQGDECVGRPPEAASGHAIANLVAVPSIVDREPDFAVGDEHRFDVQAAAARSASVEHHR